MYSLLHDLAFRRTLTAEAPSALSSVAAGMRRAVTGVRGPAAGLV